MKFIFLKGCYDSFLVFVSSIWPAASYEVPDEVRGLLYNKQKPNPNILLSNLIIPANFIRPDALISCGSVDFCVKAEKLNNPFFL